MSTAAAAAAEMATIQEMVEGPSRSWERAAAFGDSWETEAPRRDLSLVNTGFRDALTLSRSGGGENGWGWSSS